MIRNVVIPSSRPYSWPCEGAVNINKVAVIIIDMQLDFCAPGGYIADQGIDLKNARATIKPIQKVLEAARENSEVLVIHTREGHRPEMVDLPFNKVWRSEQVSVGIGNKGPLGKLLIRGEPGWEIIPELQPIQGEIIIDKPGKGAFYATDLEHILRTSGITHLILAGLTADVCVQTTIREANDRGFETLLLRDATAATEDEHKKATISMIEMQGGIFGATSTSAEFCDALFNI